MIHLHKKSTIYRNFSWNMASYPITFCLLFRQSFFWELNSFVVGIGFNVSGINDSFTAISWKDHIGTVLEVSSSSVSLSLEHTNEEGVHTINANIEVESELEARLLRSNIASNFTNWKIYERATKITRLYEFEPKATHFDLWFRVS